MGAVPSDRMRLNSEQILPLISVRRAGLEKRGVRPTKWNPELTWEKWVLKEGGIADMGEVKVLETEERAGKWKRHLSSSSQNEEKGWGLGGAKKLKRGAAKTPAAAGLGREGPGSGSCGEKCPREDEEVASPRAGKRRGSMASVVGAGYAVAMRGVEMLADIGKLLEQGEEKEKEEEQVRSEEEEE